MNRRFNVLVFIFYSFLALASAAEPELSNAVLADGSNTEAKDWVTTDITYLASVDGSQQPARYRAAMGTEARPLLVLLHTWGGNYRQRNLPQVEEWCKKQNWHLIVPDFRGPASTP